MGWAAALFGRLTMWNSNKSRSSNNSAGGSSSSSSCPAPELTLRELNKATQSMSAAMLIGRGQNNKYATAVYRASLPFASNNGKAAAVAKRLFGPPTGAACSSWTASSDDFLRHQVLVLSRLRHGNVVRLLGYTIDPTADVRVLLFEFADLGTLHDALHGPREASSSSSRPVLSWAQRAGIALDVARGLEYLHDKAGVSHGGITSTNVLLFQGFRAKIADFDLFMQLPPDEVEDGYTCVTSMEKAWYIPPEYPNRCLGIKGKFDVYSYGALLLELLTGRKSCDATSSPGILLEWADRILREGKVEQFMDPRIGTHYPRAQALEMARIALCCVQWDPLSRPSMAAVAKLIAAKSYRRGQPWPSRLALDLPAVSA